MKITFSQISNREENLIRRAFSTFARHEPDKVNGTYTNGIRKVNGREYITIRKDSFENVVAVFRVTTQEQLRRIYFRWPKELKNS